MNDWNGIWWPESLEGSERSKYEALVAELKSGNRDPSHVARDIFHQGHEHGWDLAEKAMMQAKLARTKREIGDDAR
jgi:hypothetical protein